MRYHSIVKGNRSVQANPLVGLDGAFQLAPERVEEGVDLLLALQVDPFMGAAEHLADADIDDRLGCGHRGALAHLGSTASSVWRFF
jgi:hypothetical protein